MKNYYLKIRDRFYANIRNGKKRHEYRLATLERRQINIGDTLVLISNQNKKNYVKASVKSIKLCSNWEEALKDCWQDDFEGIYDTYEEVLKECYRYYQKDDVEKDGIIVFTIEPVVIDYCNTSVLLDTNIVIKRESLNNVSFEIAKLFNWFNKEKTEIYIHSLTKEELSSYGKEIERKAMMTKLASYDILPDFTSESDKYFTHCLSLYSKDKNGEVDNALLKEVYNDNVGILLTDDKLILQKAQDLYLRDRVLTSSELLEKFETAYPDRIEYKMLAVKLKPFSLINLADKFFDTLREDYGGRDFDIWFKKKASRQEKAYVFESKEGLKGFLYLKVELEDESDYLKVTPILEPKKRLKVGTFKIESSGFRLGERFLKIIFDSASKFKVDEIYVTLFEDRRDDVVRLKNLMEQWGFRKYGKKNTGEIVLLKSLQHYDENQGPMFNYPLISGDSRYFFLPIYSQYHTDLFPDNILQNENMHLYKENKAHRYAIEKIYLTGAFNIKARSGDIVVIYRAGERQPKMYSSVVTGIAILENIIFTKDVEECIELCKNRSIFDEKEIRTIYSRYPTVIKLLDYKTFKNKVLLKDLYENEIVEKFKGPRPFASITKDQFDLINILGMGEKNEKENFNFN